MLYHAHILTGDPSKMCAAVNRAQWQQSHRESWDLSVYLCLKDNEILPERLNISLCVFYFKHCLFVKLVPSQFTSQFVGKRGGSHDASLKEIKQLPTNINKAARKTKPNLFRQHALNKALWFINSLSNQPHWFWALLSSQFPSRHLHLCKWRQ